MIAALWQRAKGNMKKLTAILLLMTCQTAFGGKFVIPVLPDTQLEINYYPAMFNSQLNWLAANKTALNIPIVLHVGDIIHWDSADHREWTMASNGFALLDNAGIPYALTLGNHDTAAVGEGGSAVPGQDTHANLRVTTQFNTFFPVSRFTAQRGRYQNGKSDNAWYTFEAGGMQWLVLTLEFCSRQGPVDWAKTVIASHTNYNVIILTHYHLNSDGTISSSNAGYGDLSPQSIYNQLISQYPNILLVLSGHVSYSAWRNDVGVSGNRIYQILQDYQSTDCGGGYIRLLEIDTTARTISAKMYSPYYNLTKSDSSQFSFFNVHFVAVLSPITLVGPTDNSIVNANGAIFSCQPCQNAVRYQLLMGADPSAMNLVICDSNQPPQKRISTFPYDTTYWTIKAYDASSSSISADPIRVRGEDVCKPILTSFSKDYLACMYYEPVWQKVISPTVSEYCFAVKVKNAGSNSLQNVTMDLNSVPDNVTVLNDKIFFDSIPAGQEVLSKDSFIVRIDSSHDGDEYDIAWQITNKLERDFSGDGRTSLADLLFLNLNWLRTGFGLNGDIYADHDNRAVNLVDFALFAQLW